MFIVKVQNYIIARNRQMKNRINGWMCAEQYEVCFSHKHRVYFTILCETYASIEIVLKRGENRLANVCVCAFQLRHYCLTISVHLSYAYRCDV